MSSANSVIVVGGGLAGHVVARRRAERGDEVVLLEAGPPYEAATRLEAGICDVGPGGVAVDHVAARLGSESTSVPRGRIVGGSGVVNGGYCLPAPPGDIATWGEDWPRRYRRGVERAAGRLRPRLAPLDPVARAVADLFPARMVRVPQARENGRRRTPVEAWAPQSVGVEVRAGARVEAVAAPGTVVLESGEEVRADEVVLCAGAIESPAILARSGLGDETVRGRDHPEVLVTAPAGFPAAARSLSGEHPALLSAVARLRLGEYVIEVRPYSRPWSELVPGGAAVHQIGVALMNPRGEVEVRSGAAAPGGGVEVDYDVAADPIDVEVLGEAAELVGAMLGWSGEPAAGGADGVGGARRTTSQHLSCTLPPEFAVTGPAEGVRVVDASIVPGLPTVGPFLTVAAVAEVLSGDGARSEW